MLQNVPAGMNTSEYLRQFPSITLVVAESHLDDSGVPRLGSHLRRGGYVVDWFDFFQGMRLGGSKAILDRLNPHQFATVVQGEDIWVELDQFLNPLLVPNPILLGDREVPPNDVHYLPAIYIHDSPLLTTDLLGALGALRGRPRKLFPHCRASYAQVAGLWILDYESTDHLGLPIWSLISSQVKPGTVVPVWSAASGELGWQFTIVEIDQGARTVVVESPTAKNLQRIPADEIDVVWEHWEAYKAGQVLRSELRDSSRHLTYVFSILRLIEGINLTIHDDWAP